MANDKTSGMKSAYEAALEKLERAGIERPREDALSEDLRGQLADIRRRAEAKLAELEILHRDRLAKIPDPGARREAEEEYARERRRVEDDRDRKIERTRGQAASKTS